MGVGRYDYGVSRSSISSNVWLALERGVYSTKSFIIALALVRGQLSVERASTLSHVEVLSQIETWGEVEDSK